MDNDEERRGREKFVRERDYISVPRRDTIDRPRDFNPGGIKRVFNRREDDADHKKGRFETASDSFEPQFNRKEEPSVPILLTFKKFLSTQDETITDEEAIARYVEYKIDFRKKECERYFQAHKDEEWFRQKYHPEESKEQKSIHQSALNRRLEVFNEFVAKGLIGNINLDYSNAAEIIRLMDSVVVRLEDGTDEDLEDIKNEEIDDESLLDLSKTKPCEENQVKTEDATDKTNGTNQNGILNKGEIEQTTEGNVKTERRKTQLHKTCSIFFRNVPKNAKIADLENVCKQHPGFLRIGLTDPHAETSMRRGYVTYRRDVNIKEIFWNLRNIKLLGTDVGASVNRDLRQRIRSVNGLTLHRPIVTSDIRQAAKLIALFDLKNSFYLSDDGIIDETLFDDLESAIVKSKNPIFKNIIDHLVEEENAEEELLLGYSTGKGEEAAKSPLEIDKNMLKSLDRLVVYLRVVHSIDYYNCSEYISEDTMPNRLGIFHVRGKQPDSSEKTDGGIPIIDKSSTEEYLSTFQSRIETLIQKNTPPLQAELEKLGKRDPEKSVEDFINSNCVEQAKDKWLCPLSGKKFKAPEFIQKHLHSKYQDKLDEIQNEAIYYNNFLMDSNRPHDLEPKSQLQSSPEAAVNSSVNQSVAPPRPLSSVAIDNSHIPSTNDNYERPYRQNWSSNRNFPRRMGHFRDDKPFSNRPRYYNEPINELNRMNERRPAPSYRDLDAPEEIF